MGQFKENLYVLSFKVVLLNLMMGVQTTGRREIWGHQDCQTQVLGSSVYLLCPAVWAPQEGGRGSASLCCAGQDRGRWGGHRSVWLGAACSLEPSQPLGHITKGHCTCVENFPAINKATEAMRRYSSASNPQLRHWVLAASGICLPMATVIVSHSHSFLRTISSGRGSFPQVSSEQKPLSKVMSQSMGRETSGFSPASSSPTSLTP